MSISFSQKNKKVLNRNYLTLFLLVENPNRTFIFILIHSKMKRKCNWAAIKPVLQSVASLLFSVFYGSLKELKIAMNFNFCFRPTSKSLTELHHRVGIKGGVHVLGKIFPLAPSPSPLLEESLSSTFTCRPFLSAQVGPPNFKNYPSRLFMLIFPRNQRGVNVARSGYSGGRWRLWVRICTAAQRLFSNYLSPGTFCIKYISQ